MNRIFVIIVMALIAALEVNGDQYDSDYTLNEPSIKMEILYESLCPDSIDFIVEQLEPNYESLEGSLYPDLVPFGHANISGNRMTCQHGPPECLGNRRMACIVERFKDPTEVGHAIKAIACLMRNQSPAKCVEKHLPGIRSREIERCARTRESMNYMIEYAERTGDRNFVPYLILNGLHTRELQNKCRHNLVDCVCEQLKADQQHLPAICHKRIRRSDEAEKRFITQRRREFADKDRLLRLVLRGLTRYPIRLASNNY